MAWKIPYNVARQSSKTNANNDNLRPFKINFMVLLPFKSQENQWRQVTLLIMMDKSGIEINEDPSLDSRASQIPILLAHKKIPKSPSLWLSDLL